MVAQTGPGSSPGVKQWFGFAREGYPTRSARRVRLGCGITAKSVQILPGERRAVRLRFWIRWGNEERERGNEPRRAEWSCEFRPLSQAAETLRRHSRDGTRNSCGLRSGRFAPSTLRFRSFSSRITTGSYNSHASIKRKRESSVMSCNALVSKSNRVKSVNVHNTFSEI